MIHYGQLYFLLKGRPELKIERKVLGFCAKGGPIVISYTKRNTKIKIRKYEGRDKTY